jgi:chromate transporter
MAIFIGYEKRGWPGLLVAGCCFIFPAAIMVAAIDDYVRYGALPQVNAVLYAVKPVVIAVIIQAFWKLMRTAVKTKWLVIVTLAAAAMYAASTSYLSLPLRQCLAYRGSQRVRMALSHPNGT